MSRLRDIFEGNVSGPGIWKWRHYFPAYERHLAKFVGREVVVLEVGVYSGGSLHMWRDYLGERCSVIGVDIEPACEIYANEHTRIFVGDQADSAFWADVLAKAPRLDVVIDDGGHEPEQQRATFDAVLPHLVPGGVYICEDIHGVDHPFHRHLRELADGLNAFDPTRLDEGPGTAARASPVQEAIRSVCFYPFLAVVERTDAPVARLEAPKHGTEWQPFFG